METSGRHWETIKSGGIHHEVSMEEINSIGTHAANYVPEIAAILAKVPRPLLLILKTNDLLRSVSRALHLATWANAATLATYVFKTPLGIQSGWRYRFQCYFQIIGLRLAVWLYEIGWVS
jgi:aarF domain-containing kinase